MIFERLGKNDRKFEFFDNNDENFQKINIYLNDFIIYLFGQHEIIAYILKKADIKELKEYLASSFAIILI